VLCLRAEYSVLILILYKLVEAGTHSERLSDALTCLEHPEGRCPGFRHLYERRNDTRPLPTPGSFTPLSGIEVFADIEIYDDQSTTRQLWAVFGEALVEYYAYAEDWIPELVMARRRQAS
jgi:hypothetical protein